jgi:hypothetical protein
MKRTRNLLIAAAAAAGLLTAAAPAANASTASPSPYVLPATGWTVPPGTGIGARSQPGVCGLGGNSDGQGGTAGVENVVCQGGGLVFVGPAVGQIASVIGPTIIGPAVVGSLVVSAGNGAGGPAIAP